MAVFTYVAIDKSGKERKGSLDMPSKEQVMAQLKAEGLIIASLTEAGALNKDLQVSFMDKKPTSRDLSVFCRQFVSIVEAGVPVTSALEMLSEQTENPMLAQAVGESRTAIQSGMSLTEAMREHPKVFPSLLVTMVAAGEASGSLEIAFNRMATQFEKEAKLKSMIKKASIYPTAILIVAFAVVILLLLFVIPQFEDMLTQMGMELPALTQWVLAASEYLQANWYIVFGIMGLAGVGLSMFGKTDSGKHFFGKLMIKLPLIGPLTVKGAAARMARTLSTLVAAGISLPDALEIVSDTMDNVYFQESLLQAREDVSMGTPLAEPIIKSELYPPMVCHMIKIGEEVGDLENMLNKLADYYEEEVEMAVASVMAAIEPMIIILLAGVVGTIVMAVMLPMGAMYEGLGNL